MGVGVTGYAGDRGPAAGPTAAPGGRRPGAGDRPRGTGYPGRRRRCVAPPREAPAQPARAVAVDLGSRNGTLLNGLPVTARTQLTDGDVIRIGRTELIVRAAHRRAGAGRRPSDHLRRARPAAGTPAAPVIERPPGHLRTLATRVFAGSETDPVFRTYQELPRRVPIGGLARGPGRERRVVPPADRRAARLADDRAHRVLRAGRPASSGAVLGRARASGATSARSSSANQSARVFGFTLGRTAPRWVRERGYLLAMALFFGIAGARLAVFNDDGTATAVLLAAVVLSAFVGGVLFKGKSGWCSSICPLLPLQRVYGQTPFVLSPNSHCQPCLACTRNCFDFQPQVAQQADLHDADAQMEPAAAAVRERTAGLRARVLHGRSTSRRCRPRRCTGGWCCSCSAASAGSSSWRRCSGSRPGWSPPCGERSPSTSSTGSARTPSATRCRRCSGWVTSTGCGGRSSACWPPSPSSG